MEMKAIKTLFWIVLILGLLFVFYADGKLKQAEAELARREGSSAVEATPVPVSASGLLDKGSEALGNVNLDTEGIMTAVLLGVLVFLVWQAIGCK